MVDLHGFTLFVWPGFLAIVITFGMVKLPSVDVTENAGTVKFNNRWRLLCLCFAVKWTQFSFATFRISAGPFMVKSPLECKESRIFYVWFLCRSWSKSIKAGSFIIFQSVCSLITLLYDSLLLFVHSFGMLDSNIGTKWLGVHVPVPHDRYWLPWTIHNRIHRFDRLSDDWACCVHRPSWWKGIIHSTIADRVINAFTAQFKTGFFVYPCEDSPCIMSEYR